MSKAGDRSATGRGGMKLERIASSALAGAVRPEKTHDLAFADLEIQI